MCCPSPFCHVSTFSSLCDFKQLNSANKLNWYFNELMMLVYLIPILIDDTEVFICVLISLQKNRGASVDIYKIVLPITLHEMKRTQVPNCIKACQL